MSLPDRRRRAGRWPRSAWRAREEEEEEAWERSPSPRRGRWERPAPADWGSEEPLDEDEPDAWAGASPSPPPVWERPEPRRARGRPPSEDGGSLEEPRRQWEARPGGGRRSSAERTRGGRRGPPSSVTPSRQQRPDGEGRAWGSPWREGAQERRKSSERPQWEPRHGKWASARRRRDESRSPSRERRSLGSSGRDGKQEYREGSSGWNQPRKEEAAGGSDGAGGWWGRTERRGREQSSPPRRQSGRGTPQRETRKERSGSSRYQEREQSRSNPDGGESRWRGKSYRSRSRDERNWESLKGEWQSPNGEEEEGQDSFIRYREAEDQEDGGGAEWKHHERRGEKKWTDAAGSGSPEASAPFTGLIAGSSAEPKEWKPCEAVVHWWRHCQRALQKKNREQLMSMCPRPTLPDRSSETPKINPSILSLLTNKKGKELRAATRFNFFLQEEVLDLLAPAMTIYEMAEEAIENDEPVDTMELLEWARRILRFIGSINTRLIYQQRSQVLGTISPRLKMVVGKLSGPNNDGMLFAEDKVKLLKEIIMRFPQLTDRRDLAKRKLQSLAGVVYYKQGQRRPLRGFHSKPVGTGMQGTADQPAEQSYSQEATLQGPAEWH